ncbi:MAG: hypothetical protein M1817_006791 [Caeruleum heppii]|nr:MAG: hypothetical protein M1817_006791 [Caeruleum heppii]
MAQRSGGTLLQQSQRLQAVASCLAPPLPFLYQTRTIRRAPRHDGLPLSRRSLGISSGRSRDHTSPFSTRAPRRARYEPPIEPPLPEHHANDHPTDEADANRPSRKHSTDHLDRRATSRPSRPYQRNFMDRDRAAPRRLLDDSYDDEGQRPKRGIYNPAAIDLEEDETSSRPMGPSKRDSTITNPEREAFARIFKDIVASSRATPENASPDKGSSDGSTAEHDAKRDRRATHDGLSFEPGTRATKDRPQRESDQQILARYPPTLREAAARASGLYRIQQERLRQKDDLPESPVNAEDELIEKQRQQHLARVEGLLRSAETDIKLWAVLEEHVFPMISHLEPRQDHLKKTKKSRTTKAKTMTRSGVGDTTSNLTENLPLAVVGANYPHLLLLAIRLLRNDFRSPTTCLSLFERIKSLGSISYVLGASTALFNEMVDLKWRVYHDFHGVEGLLAEMDKAGVEFDHATQRVLREIALEKADVVRGTKGAVMEAMWQLEGVREGLTGVAGWRAVIKDRLAEKESMALV